MATLEEIEAAAGVLRIYMPAGVAEMFARSALKAAEAVRQREARMGDEEMVVALRKHADRIAQIDDPDTTTALRWAASRIASLSASHARLLEALRKISGLAGSDGLEPLDEAIGIARTAIA